LNEKKGRRNNENRKSQPEKKPQEPSKVEENE